MSEDISKEPLPPTRREPLGVPADYVPLDYQERPPYPRTVTAAGVIWVIYGCLAVLSLAMILISTFIVAANQGARAGVEAGGGLSCPATIYFLIAVVFIRIGSQYVRGIARDTLLTGIASILGAVLLFAVAAYFPGRGEFIEAGIAGLAGTILLAAGILALAGRRQYKLWRTVQSISDPFR